MPDPVSKSSYCYGHDGGKKGETLEDTYSTILPHSKFRQYNVYLEIGYCFCPVELGALFLPYINCGTDFVLLNLGHCFYAVVLGALFLSSGTWGTVSMLWYLGHCFCPT